MEAENSLYELVLSSCIWVLGGSRDNPYHAVKLRESDALLLSQISQNLTNLLVEYLPELIEANWTDVSKLNIKVFIEPSNHEIFVGVMLTNPPDMNFRWSAWENHPAESYELQEIISMCIDRVIYAQNWSYFDGDTTWNLSLNKP